jgi:hypothetical protein
MRGDHVHWAARCRHSELPRCFPAPSCPPSGQLQADRRRRGDEGAKSVESDVMEGQRVVEGVEGVEGAEGTTQPWGAEMQERECRNQAQDACDSAGVTG